MGKEVVNETAVNAAALRELQGLSAAMVDGASASTKIAIAAMRQEDTIIGVLSFEVANDSVGASMVTLDRTSAFSIVSTKASGTLTISSTGPLNNETLNINGVVYTFKTAGTQSMATHIPLGLSNSATLDNLVAVVNAYESRRLGSGHNNPVVTAEKTSAAVVTIRAVLEGPGNGITVASGSASAFDCTGTDTHEATIVVADVAEDDEFVVNGLTFVVKDEPDSANPLEIATGADDAEMAANVANALNSYANAFGFGVLDVAATSDGIDTVTLVPATFRKGNQIVLTENATNLAASGAGKLAGGTNTGGIVSATDTSGEKLLVLWFNKR